jgi:hypothetical protein
MLHHCAHSTSFPNTWLRSFTKLSAAVVTIMVIANTVSGALYKLLPTCVRAYECQEYPISDTIPCSLKFSCTVPGASRLSSSGCGTCHSETSSKLPVSLVVNNLDMYTESSQTR